MYSSRYSGASGTVVCHGVLLMMSDTVQSVHSKPPAAAVPVGPPVQPLPCANKQEQMMHQPATFPPVEASAPVAAPAPTGPPVAVVHPMPQIQLEGRTHPAPTQRTLTRQQVMLEAQDIFRNANRVTPPEKAFIIDFMSGCRANPCPHLGDIITIKLSENFENVLQQDGTYITRVAEVHISMDYNTGLWTRIRKYRPRTLFESSASPSSRSNNNN